MPHATPLIATIVAGLGLRLHLRRAREPVSHAAAGGLSARRRLVGPITPGFVADQIAGARAGRDRRHPADVRRRPAFLARRTCCPVRADHGAGRHRADRRRDACLALALAWMLGWHARRRPASSASPCRSPRTVVLLRALQERRLIETERGRIAVGWLIVEDLAMVQALVLLPALAGALGGTRAIEPTTRIEAFAAARRPRHLGVLGVTLAKVAAFVAIMLVVGRRVIPWILHYVAHTGSRELFRLSVLAIALGVAFGAAHAVRRVAGARRLLRRHDDEPNPSSGHRAAEEPLPLRDAFAVLFFVSVGMLFDPTSLVDHPWPILATLFIIVIGKSVAAFADRASPSGHPIGTALTISASLAQIGEFSFILAEPGRRARTCCPRRAGPHPGRRDPLHPAQSAASSRPSTGCEPWLEKRAGATTTAPDLPAKPRRSGDEAARSPSPSSAPAPAPPENQTSPRPTTKLDRPYGPDRLRPGRRLVGQSLKRHLASGASWSSRTPTRPSPVASAKA